MASALKIFIVTSDADAIEKFFSKKTSNTHIIDLSSDITDDSSTNSNISLIKVTDLDKIVSDGNQSYKRIEKKNNNRACVVCGDQANGYHYGAITCNSCKVFFTRNGRLSVDKIHCRHGQDKCPVSHDIQRKCTKCRLVRCFSQGMRTDHFFTDQMKQRRRNQNNENTFPQESLTKSDHILMDTNHEKRLCLSKTNNPFSHVLPMEDWLTIQSIQSSYLLAFQDESMPSFRDISDPLKAISCWSQIKHQLALHFITFFHHIDEFKSLNTSDRCILVKYNFLYLMLLHKWSNYDILANPFPDLPDEVRTIFHRWFHDSPEATEFLHGLINLNQSFIRITEQEPTLLRLLSVMVLFSTGMLRAEDKFRLNDSPAIHRAQSHYTRLISNYLMDKHGEQKAIQQFTQLMDVILQIEIFTKQLKDFVRTRFIKWNIVDRLSPLIQNAFDIP